jgi:peptidoglycan/LPS O-acetylase OafA/YrhL
MAWATWRFIERPAHRWTKASMTASAENLGWKSLPKAKVGSEITPA